MDAAYLLRFKGRNGLCFRLQELHAALAEVDASPARVSSGVVSGHGSGPSDPTQRDALALIRRKENILAEIAEVEALIGEVGSILMQAPHGEWIADYYLDATGYVTWELLAEDAKVTTRTMLNWRSACLAWIELQR